ncbi:NosD domain-containing protein [Methanogenium organophilum]|uniref:Right-handed parallel beta-helix repeat-containing protein n=1 Tax=Methanogenium organophilum TaxID=2199 RepID=A0A9X9T703_METOG|nr:NosD domain-containing protein [Methanogenium organophilum]WAI00519.1 right-handed parallel beta-helix repeat-containing protein [Methanogenium organophilum]
MNNRIPDLTKAGVLAILFLCIAASPVFGAEVSENGSFSDEQPMLPEIISIGVTPATADILIGGTQQFTAVACDASGQTIPDMEFIWESSDGTVGMVDESGLFTALSKGTVIVSAINGSMSASSDVTVSDEIPKPMAEPTGKATLTGINKSVEGEGLVPVIAESTGTKPLSDYNHIFVKVANDGGVKYNAFENNTYNIRFEGYDRGLNALHISTSSAPADKFGQVTVTENQSGTFYATDSGGKGYEDEILLMVAVNGTIPDDFSVRVQADGYTWTPNPVSNQAPPLDNVTYQPVALDEIFTKEDFMYGPQIWKPTGNGFDYPIYYGQNMTDTENTFQLMFIDLNAGVLRPNEALENNGAVRINYTLENLESFAAFGVYGYCQNSNNGDDMVAWANAVIEPKIVSGYSVIGSGSGPVPDRIEVEPTMAQVVVGDVYHFAATAFDALNNVISGLAFSWASSDEIVGTIDESGNFTALAPGTTNVTASRLSITGTSAVTVVSPEPVTWYVGDDEIADFTTIQAAINAAKTGDTILVRNGTYAENLNIAKTLIIQSENGSGQTTIQAASSGSPAITITADNVTLDGFTITGATGRKKAGISLNGGDHCIFANNIVTGNYVGIHITSGTSATVTGNYIHHNSDRGLYLSVAPFTTVTHNDISENAANVELEYRSTNATFAQNSINHTTKTTKNAVTVYANNLTFTGNRCEDSAQGFFITNGNDARITNNTFHNSKYDLKLSRSAGDIVARNTFVEPKISLDTCGEIAFNTSEPVSYQYSGTKFTSYLGNYYGDYVGTDADGNGIGEENRTINGDYIDFHPLMKPGDDYCPIESPVLTSITVVPGSAEVILHETFTFTATVCDQYGSDMGEIDLNWSLKCPDLGEIDENGFFTARQIGTTTVIATADGISGTANITVIPIPEPVTHYVGDGGEYDTIQAAVDAARNGDTILVRNGTYAENLNIAKTLIIQSENGSGQTTIQAASSGSPAITITADNVTLDGFTITGATGRKKAGISLNGGDHCIFANNIVTGNYVGIHITSGTSATVTGNYIHHNSDRGLYLSVAPFTTVTHNDISENAANVELEYRSTNATFAQNSINHTTKTTKNAVTVYANNLTFTGNRCEDSAQGFFITNGNDARITNNTFHNSKYDLKLSRSAGDIVARNTFVEPKISLDTCGEIAFNTSEPVSYQYSGTKFTSYLGNYYGDYVGTDADGNGIGEENRTINGDYIDFHPLMKVGSDYRIVASTPLEPVPLPNDGIFYFKVANDDETRFNYYGNNTYKHCFTGGGLNSFHLTKDPLGTGEMHSLTGDQRGSFFLTDTGGKGYFHDAILLVAVNGTIPDDFSLHIRSNGFIWTPAVSQDMSAATDIQYIEGAVDEIFTKDDFIYGPQNWKPYKTDDHLPLYYGQNMSDEANTFRLMYIDLKVGGIGYRSGVSGLENDGAAVIEYTFENLTSFAAVNGYGWRKTGDNDGEAGWTNADSSLAVRGVPSSEESVLTKIVIAPGSDVEVTDGETIQFSTTCYDQYTREMDGIPINWSFSHPKIGTVNDNGLFTANGVGTGYLTASHGDITASKTVTVLSSFHEPHTWYVDDSGGKDFTTISDAINSSRNGDTIIVRNGTYSEHVKITKDLTICSEHGPAGTNIIPVEPWQYTVHVTTENATFRGFTVGGPLSEGEVGVGFGVSAIRLDGADNCTISENVIEPCDYSIYLRGSSKNVLENNHLPSGGQQLSLDNSQDNIVTGSEFSNVYIWCASGNVLTENIFRTCYAVITGSGNVFFANTFRGSVDNFAMSSNCAWNSTESVAYTYNEKAYVGFVGNYWEYCNGTDTDGDGIIDTPYKLDEHPLNGMWVDGAIISPEVDHIIVSPGTTVVAMGDSKQFTAFTYDTSGNIIDDSPCGWTIDNTTVGMVNYYTGLFIPQAVGEAIITATYPKTGVIGTAKVSVVLDPKTWYVDDSGGADYTTIQSAVDASRAWDRIVVREGEYVENVEVGKPLTIISADGPEKTIVRSDSLGHVFTINADYVTISGFTTTGARSVDACGIYGGDFDRYFHHCNFTNNILSGNRDAGIRLNYFSDCIIENNRISKNKYGIYMWGGVNNAFINDTIKENERGLRLLANNGGGGNIIFQNTFVNNTYSPIIESVNIWNSTEPVIYVYKGTTCTEYIGNYWDDYNGIDRDGDGIGDTSYALSGGNIDSHPLVMPGAYYLPSDTDTKQNIALSIPGMIITETGYGQEISVNTSLADITISDDGNIITIDRGSYYMNILTQGVHGDMNGTVNGTVAGIILDTAPVTTQFDALGNVTASLMANLTGITLGAALETTISENVSTAAQSAFQLAAIADGLDLDAVAYTMNIVKTNLTNGQDIADATIRMAVSPAWVAANGGYDGVKIIRFAEDGTREVLDTVYLGFDGELDQFEAYSPNGLSVFGLSATSAAAGPAGTGFSTSGGGVSSTSSARCDGISAGDTAVFVMDRTAVSEVDVKAATAIPSMMLTAETVAKPSSVSDAPGELYQYIEITSYYAPEDCMQMATLKFSVDPAWLSSIGSSATGVEMYRYNEASDTWDLLSTVADGEADSGYRFFADTPSFSLFAITAEKGASAPAEVVPTDAPKQPSGDSTTPSQAEPTTSAATQTPAATGSIPTMVIIAFIAIIGVCGVGYRRKNAGNK